MKAYYVLSIPISILFILNSKHIHKKYKFTLLKKLGLGFRMFLNTVRIRTGTSYKSHMVMALKILETPPDVCGDIIECGTWKGGCAANLSLVCNIVGRKLLIFDSFEGLPEGAIGDREAQNYKKGDYCGALEEVKRNIFRYGEIESCEFVKGWFEETLPYLHSPVLLAFLDVDLEASLDTCVRYIWPNLVDKGYIFIDEAVGTDYCALFYSEKYWKIRFNQTPPGIIGAGTGLALGEYYIGPWSERNTHPTWHHNAGAFTRKDMSGYWSYYPDEDTA
ncbi:MAG: TylF/MycF/NovP-related O-methyltransferase [bacterium]|nr:TylF/MycF/NovP-related O-methyltransferase [bacterium]